MFVEHCSQKTKAHRHATICYNCIYLFVVLLTRHKDSGSVNGKCGTRFFIGSRQKKIRLLPSDDPSNPGTRKPLR